MSGPQRSAAAVSAATVANLPLGTLYAFSVFLKPVEALLGASRAELSAVFAFATVTLTLGMNLAPRLYRSIAPATLIVASGVCSAAGLALCANASGFWQFGAGYGVLFGLGAGVVFTVSQQGVNQTVATRRGLANGYVVSLYPLGAMLGAPVFGWAIEGWGARATLAGLAAVVLAASVIAAGLLHVAEIRMRADARAGETAASDWQWPLFLRLAGVFVLAAAAGLTVMSQVAGMVQAYGGTTALALGATTLITGAIAAARIGGGWLVDRFEVPHVAVFAHLWSLAGAVALSVWPGPLLAVPALAMIGMGYGFVSGLTVGAIARYWHPDAFGRVASRLYIAWCAGALTLPILAGWLYDRTQGYGTAVMVAGAVNVIGVIVALGLPRRRERSGRRDTAEVR